VKRWLLKVEDSHLLRTLLRLDVRRLSREPDRMPFRRVER